MYSILFWYENYGFTCSWTFNTLAEALDAEKTQQAKGYTTRIVRL